MQIKVKVQTPSVICEQQKPSILGLNHNQSQVTDVFVAVIVIRFGIKALRIFKLVTVDSFSRNLF